MGAQHPAAEGSLDRRGEDPVLRDRGGSHEKSQAAFFAQIPGIKLCSNSLIYLPKFANLDFLEDTTPDATLKNVILRF